MHCQNLHQYGKNETTITKIITLGWAFLSTGSLSNQNPSAKYAQMIPISTNDDPMLVTTSVKKKSLNLTDPNGEIAI